MPGKVNHALRELARQQIGKLSRLQRLFLEAYDNSYSIHQAAEKVGCYWRSHYFWLEKNPEYARQFEQIRQSVGDKLEAEVLRAALHGDQVPIVEKGVITSWYSKKSDIMRIFALKGFKYNYRDNPQLAVQINNHPPAVHFNIINDLDLSPKTAETTSQIIDLDELREIAKKE